MTKTRIYTPSEPRFSLRWWLGALRDALFIAVITLLIWAYADMEFTDDKDFQADIFFTTANSPDLLLVSPRAPVEVTFKVRGTRSTLGTFQRQLDVLRRQVAYDVSRGYAPGKNDVRTEDLLNNALGLSRQGLSILSATPTQISFELDQRVEQVARVELDQVGATLTGEAKIEPAETTLRLAASDLRTLRANLPADEPITVKTRRLDLRNVPTNVPYTTEVEILPPPAQYPVEMGSKTARVTVQIDQRTDVKEFRVPVQLRQPYTWAGDATWDDYQLVMKDPLEWQPTIRVQGARKDLDRLRAEDVEAHVTLTADDKTQVASWLARQVIVRFPKGMDVQFVGEAPTVNFKLERRPLAPAAPPAP